MFLADIWQCWIKVRAGKLRVQAGLGYKIRSVCVFGEFGVSLQ